MAIVRGAKPGTTIPPGELIDDVEKKIERVRILYSLYFQGVEKLEPALPRAEIQRLMRDLRKLNLKSTQRFRFHNLLSRFSILEEQWSRTVRKIEEGRFRPHLFRLQLHEHGQVGPSSSLKSVASALGAFSPRSTAGAGGGKRRSDLSEATGESAAFVGANLRGALTLLKPGGGDDAASSAPKPTGAQGVYAPASRSSRAPDENRLREIFDDYVAARRQTGEEIAGVTFDAIRSAVLTQVPAISEKTPCDQVDFKVVIRAGKAVLKAVPISGKTSTK